MLSSPSAFHAGDSLIPDPPSDTSLIESFVCPSKAGVKLWSTSLRTILSVFSILLPYWFSSRPSSLLQDCAANSAVHMASGINSLLISAISSETKSFPKSQFSVVAVLADFRSSLYIYHLNLRCNVFFCYFHFNHSDVFYFYYSARNAQIASMSDAGKDFCSPLARFFMFTFPPATSSAPQMLRKGMALRSA